MKLKAKEKLQSTNVFYLTGPYGGLELVLDAQQYEYMFYRENGDNFGAGNVRIVKFPEQLKGGVLFVKSFL